MTRIDGGTKARCAVNECGTIIKMPNSGTSGCRVHLKRIHNIDLEAMADDPEAVDVKIRSPPSKITKNSAETETYAGYLARLCAVANIPFNTLASDEFLEIFELKGFGAEMVKSPNIIRQYILSFADETRREISKNIRECASLNRSALSLAIDEFTSAAARRYWSVKVHAQTQCWNLGLFRVRGNSPAKQMTPLLTHILAEHGLDLQRHVIGVTSSMEVHGEFYYYACLGTTGKLARRNNTTYGLIIKLKLQFN